VCCVPSSGSCRLANTCDSLFRDVTDAKHRSYMYDYSMRLFLPSSYRNRLLSHRTSLLNFFIRTTRYNAIALCLRVSVPVKTVSPAKADEPIEMPFGGVDSCVFDPKKSCIEWGV